MGLLTKIFGTHSERELKKITPIVDKIEALEAEYKKLSDQFDEGVYAAIDLDRCVAERKSYGGPAPENVLETARSLYDFAFPYTSYDE